MLSLKKVPFLSAIHSKEGTMNNKQWLIIVIPKTFEGLGESPGVRIGVGVPHYREIK